MTPMTQDALQLVLISTPIGALGSGRGGGWSSPSAHWFRDLPAVAIV